MALTAASSVLLAVLVGACFHERQPVPAASAQSASLPVWQDSTSMTPEAAIYRRWQEYIRSKRGGLAVNASTPSPLWAADEQAKWPMYDLAGFYVPDGSVSEVVSIHPAEHTRSSEYEVVTRFLLSGSTGTPRTVLTMAVYAVQLGNQWRFANALPRRTRSWYSERIGQITYFIEPGLRFDRSKARRAVAFVDSLAVAFEVPPLGPVDYYVTATVDGALHALGVDYPTTFGPGGGFAKPVNRQVFAAVPHWGEEYRHELAHLVLLPLVQGRSVTIIASEGIATWLGGTAGMDRARAAQGLRSYLSAHPTVSLDSALTLGGLPQTQTYVAGAVLCELVFRQGGTAALKQFLRMGPGPVQLRAGLLELLQRPWDRIQADWRDALEHMAGAKAPSPNPRSQLTGP